MLQCVAVRIFQLLGQAPEVEPDKLRLVVLLQESPDGPELVPRRGGRGAHIWIVGLIPPGECTTERSAKLGLSRTTRFALLAAQHSNPPEVKQKSSHTPVPVADHHNVVQLPADEFLDRDLPLAQVLLDVLKARNVIEVGPKEHVARDEPDEHGVGRRSSARRTVSHERNPGSRTRKRVGCIKRPATVGLREKRTHVG